MILVTGGTGQVATELLRRAPVLPRVQVRLVGRPAFDFDRPDTIGAVFADTQPSLVINAAGWTAVDAAEADPAGAGRANHDGPARLARLCAAAGVPLIHISSDYVFDGAKGAPYSETDTTAPAGVYGRSKLEGEHAVLDAGGQSVILRTSWVYSAFSKNFVRTMLGAALKLPTLRVVADQYGCPTQAGDLADAVLAIAARIAAGWRAEFGGVFHAAGTGGTTWHALAVAALTEAARYGRPMPEVQAITTADWPTPAHRPADSRLDCAKLAQVFGLRLPPWQDSLPRTVEAIVTG